ncbi:MAG TPA: RNA-binding domain-containing protein [Pyrinomonadaceae bacterium]|nr:RNA-binding domain-containing protein [Pyrinomonadaceae bacterium]
MDSQVKKRILVVDDEPNWLTTIKNVLGTEYDLTLITDPDVALERVGRDNFSLVILDMRFPLGKQGPEIFRLMKERSPNLRAIILTGFPDLNEAVRSIKQGALDYIQKKDYLEKGSEDLLTDLRERVKLNLEYGENAELESLIAGGEGEELEFKSSIRWDRYKNGVNKELEGAAVKTIAAFLNSEKGGRLLLGVDDGGAIVGLEKDYSTLGKRNRDGYENHLTDLLLSEFGKEVTLGLHLRFHKIGDKEICEIVVMPSPEPVFITNQKGEHMYIRAGNSSRLLTSREVLEYSKRRWKQ